MAGITARCCGADCYLEDNDRSKPCWGRIRAIDEVVSEDDSYYIHACTGHAPVPQSPYLPEPSNLQ